jgi:hypothetical protein
MRTTVTLDDGLPTFDVAEGTPTIPGMLAYRIMEEEGIIIYP